MLAKILEDGAFFLAPFFEYFFAWEFYFYHEESAQEILFSEPLVSF